jgi:hypothetical protein
VKEHPQVKYVGGENYRYPLLRSHSHYLGHRKDYSWRNIGYCTNLVVSVKACSRQLSCEWHGCQQRNT